MRTRELRRRCLAILDHIRMGGTPADHAGIALGPMRERFEAVAHRREHGERVACPICWRTAERRYTSPSASWFYCPGCKLCESDPEQRPHPLEPDGAAVCVAVSREGCELVQALDIGDAGGFIRAGVKR